MSKRVYVRIDNRLLHGQVVQFWIPHVNVERLLVADDEVFGSESMQAIYRMALPNHVELTVLPVDNLEPEYKKLGERTSLVLIRTIADATRAAEDGCDFKRIMIGNVHASPDRKRVTDAVYLSEPETDMLLRLKNRGIDIEIQTFPGEVLKLIVEDGGWKWSR
jgi:PTS system mannose-specific IIB component